MSDLYPAFAGKLVKLVGSKPKLVLALSGGIDSRVMLDLLAEFRDKQRVNCIAVHVNHGLSKNAAAWADKCQIWCDEYQVPLYIENLTLDISSGDSLEKLARDGRYHALQKYIDAGDVLLTGQHADDQVETFLLALKRGSGPKGLAAMPEVKPFGQGIIVRPMLDISRKQVEEYAAERKLHWVDDESNLDTRFDRNFIRHRVTPLLGERWPSFPQAIRRSAQHCAEQEALLDELLTQPLNLLVDSDNSIEIEGLDEYSERARNQLLRMWTRRCGFLMPSQVQLSKLWLEVAMAAADANPQLNTSDAQFRRFNNKLYILKSAEDISDWQTPIELNTTVDLPDSLGSLTLKQSFTSGNIAIPEEKKGSLLVTFNPEGLSAHPLERNHSRKLKKLFQEYKVPSWLRRRTPILMCDGQVVAVAGLFVDRAFYGQECELIWDNDVQSV